MKTIYFFSVLVILSITSATAQMYMDLLHFKHKPSAVILAHKAPNAFFLTEKVPNKILNGTFRLDSAYHYNFFSEFDSIPASKFSYTYNEHDKVAVVTVYTWSNVSMTWAHDLRLVVEYNNQNIMISTTFYTWNAGLWAVDCKHEYQYDEQGNLSFETCYSWNSGNSVWVNSHKYESQYNDQGKLLLLKSFTWDSISNMWVISSKSELEYDTNWNMISMVDSSWDNEFNVWVKSYKVVREYDNQNSLIYETFYIWSNSWICLFMYKYEYGYDTQGNVALRTILARNNINDAWLLKGKNFNYYSDNSLFVENNEESPIAVYPNPTKDILYFDGLENAIVKVFDFSGKCLLSNSTNSTINVSNLPNGIYLLTITSKNVITTKRFVKH